MLRDIIFNFLDGLEVNKYDELWIAEQEPSDPIYKYTKTRNVKERQAWNVCNSSMKNMDWNLFDICMMEGREKIEITIEKGERERGDEERR